MRSSMPDMTTGPDQHLNPARWERCGACGHPIGAADTPQNRQGNIGRLWAVPLAVLLLAGALALGYRAASSDIPTHTGSENTVSLGQWWSTADQPFTALQDNLVDAQQALDGLNPGGLLRACQRMHETAEVGLSSSLPSPDPVLTAQLRAVIEDIHTATHQCLAVAAHSVNNYDAEFVVALDQADQLLNSAHQTISTSLASR